MVVQPNMRAVCLTHRIRCRRFGDKMGTRCFQPRIVPAKPIKKCHLCRGNESHVSGEGWDLRGIAYRRSREDQLLGSDPGAFELHRPGRDTAITRTAWCASARVLALHCRLRWPEEHH